MKFSNLLAALLFSVTAGALEIVPENQYLKVGETAVFNIALNPGRGARLVDVIIRGNRAISNDIRIKTDDSGRAKLTLPASRPGFIYVEVSDNGKSASAGVAVAKDEIRPARVKPAAFDTYWAEVKAELDRTAMQYEITKVPGKAGYLTYEVKLLMGGEGKDAYCMLTMPQDKAPGRLAAVALFFGHGVDNLSPSYRKDAIVLAVNPMSIKHDGKCGSTIRNPDGKFFMYRYWGTDNLESNYFPGMFRRNYRALQFLKSLPEWDQRTLIVYGASQGGAQALVAAGMDPQVTFCGALVPALCDHGGFDAGSESGWPRYHETEIYQNDPEKSLKVTDFIDVANFAMNITDAEVYVSAGFIDRTCPPASVYAAFNVIPSAKKTIRDELHGHHQTRKEAYKELFAKMDAHIRKMQSGFKQL